MSIIKIKQLKKPDGSNRGAFVVYDTAGYPQWTSDIHSGVLLPSGTSSARPSPATTGTIRYNTDTSQFEGYGSSTWGPLAQSGVFLKANGGTATPTEGTINFVSTTQGTTGSNMIVVSDQGSGNANVTFTQPWYRVRFRVNYTSGSIDTTGMNSGANGPNSAVAAVSGYDISNWNFAVPSNQQLNITLPSNILSTQFFAIGIHGQQTSNVDTWITRGAGTSTTWTVNWHDDTTSKLEITQCTTGGASTGSNGKVYVDLYFANFN